MKKILKYLSVIIVVIAVSVAVYSTTSLNQTVEMQNKEALAINADTWTVPCHWQIESACYFNDSWGIPHSLTGAARD